MKLNKLYETLSIDNSSFLNTYQNETLLSYNTIEHITSKIKSIFESADKYADNNKLEYKYFQLAKKPIWNDFIVESELFIYQGFEAYISIDLTENLENIKPFVTIQNDNVDNLIDGQKIEITSDFKDSMNQLQREIFEEALKKVEKRTVEKLQELWVFEQQRLDKWVKVSNINLKG